MTVLTPILADRDAEPECEYCFGTGEYFTHSDDCRDDLCVLNGDYHSCQGQVVACPNCKTIAAGEAT